MPVQLRSRNNRDDVVSQDHAKVQPSKPEPALDAMPLSSSDEEDESPSSPTDNGISVVASPSQQRSSKRRRQSHSYYDQDAASTVSDDVGRGLKRAKRQTRSRTWRPARESVPTARSHGESASSSSPSQAFSMLTKKPRAVDGSRSRV